MALNSHVAGINFANPASIRKAYEELMTQVRTEAIQISNKYKTQIEPILQYPNMEKPYTMFADASHYAYSGVLTQAVESPEDLRPIAYSFCLFLDMQ